MSMENTNNELLLREKSRMLLNSIKTKQDEIREHLSKLKQSSQNNTSATVATKTPTSSSNMVKTVSFSDYLCETKSRPTPIKYRPSKSASSSPTHSCTTSDGESESEAESSDIDGDGGAEAESVDNLAELIQFEEAELRERLRTSSEDEFKRHVEAKRQSFLRRDYNETESSDTNQSTRLSRKRVHVVAGRQTKLDQIMAKNKKKRGPKRSQSAPSYLRPTEASMNMARSKSPKSEKSSVEKNDSKKVPNLHNKTGKRKKLKMKPLLGLDFALDSIKTKKEIKATDAKLSKPEEYWQELCQFREENKDQCISSKPVNFDGTVSSLFLDQSNMKLDGGGGGEGENDLEDGINHKCIHSFTLNERLFPVPVYKDKNGQSVCPVCKSTRRGGSLFAPQFCKVSIPKHRIVESIHIEPSRKSNPRTDDTLSLAENCVAGYQNAPKKSVRSYQTPPAKNIDLKSSTMNYRELNARKPLTIADLKLIETNRDPTTCGIYSKANAMRYELEDQHLKRLRELIPKNLN